ncbi:MAP/microtubule affinity-regulating kinase 3 [Acromyrmex echinatior]|uniref:MAP/microtubule affinity-regulating kinase 3 n=1 Tax=Acromyrmex echinatior TaxID=103372 RepID=F4WG97_ACREC|nr:MAP/microtubule affinity-regulating kinase 3 [Acromyrmex echinatior]
MWGASKIRYALVTVDEPTSMRNIVTLIFNVMPNSKVDSLMYIEHLTRETTCRFTPAIMFARLRTNANFNRISCDLSRKFVGNARSQERALPRRLLRRWKRNVIAQANEQPWPRLQGRFDYYPAAVEDAAETHRSEAALDFGLSNIYTNGDPLRTHCGSPEYAAPELFIVGKRYGPEVDLWSLGVVLYGMTIGRLPFLCPRDEWTSSEERRRRLMIQINRGLTSIQEKAMYQTSIECKNLINRLLIPSARERITIREILDHPWILMTSKNNFHFRSEDDMNISNHVSIMNEIATAMRTTTAAVEAEIMRRKYGEIGGMYNIKKHKLYQASTVYHLPPRLLRNSMCQTEDISSSTTTIRMAKSNLRNGTSGNSDNTNRIIVMRRSQVQDRSVKKSLLHGSTTWNWQCRSGNENRSSEERRNYVKFDFLLPHISDPNDYDHVDHPGSFSHVNFSFQRIRYDTTNTTSLSSQQCRVPQITKQADKLSNRRSYRCHSIER